MSVKTQPNTLQDVLKWEQDNRYSRDELTVKNGESLVMLEVFGKETITVPITANADAGNTGLGSCTGVAGGSKTEVETFTLTCVEAIGNGGRFSVVGNKTGSLADASVGVSYTDDHINFTLNDAATDFVVGDKFTISVTAGSGKTVALNLTAVDGSNHAAGIMAVDCDASAADKKGVGIVRDAMIVPDDLIWPAGITAQETTDALAELAALGIITRSEA